MLKFIMLNLQYSWPRLIMANKEIIIIRQTQLGQVLDEEAN